MDFLLWITGSAKLSKLAQEVQLCQYFPKVGAILKKSVDWSDTDVILPGESIEKAIVSLQIPGVLKDEAIQVLLCQKIWIGKAIV
jgi:hypothetical protein